MTVASRASRGRRASCRATPTTRSFAPPASPGSSGRTRPSPSGSRRKPPTSSGASTGTSGSRTASTSRWRSTPTASRWTPSPRTTAIFSGAASSTSRRRRPSPGTCSGRASSPAGASAPWRRERGATTRSATTWARSGPSTTRSSPGACAGTASRTRPRWSRRASWTLPSSSRGACPRRSAATSARRRCIPVQYPTACSPQAWSTGAPLLLLRTMLGLEPQGDNLVVDAALPRTIGHLELLDIPGRWGRVDAFGRGRVDVERRRR